MNRVSALVQQYIFGRVGEDPSPASFWYLPEVTRLRSPSCVHLLETEGSTRLYPIDFRAKLTYPLISRAAPVPLLNYGGKAGRSLNPEAAFQYLLGLHDDAVARKSRQLLERFLAGASYMRAQQTDDGEFPYLFDWFECRAPWASFLAQSRGCAVMVRAWKLTGDTRWRESAWQAISRANVPVGDGGYCAQHPRVLADYLEEYPAMPNAVLNGFLSSLISLLDSRLFFEFSEDAIGLRKFLESARSIAPLYLTSWWSIYDLSGSKLLPNYHSPRYHRLVTGYLETLWALTGDTAFREMSVEWKCRDTPSRVAFGYVAKAIRKIFVR